MPSRSSDREKQSRKSQQGRESGKKKRKSSRNDPDPDPHFYKLLVDPDWKGSTDEELKEIVERAIQYIAEAQRRWGFKLGMAVGEWIYRAPRSPRTPGGTCWTSSPGSRPALQAHDPLHRASCTASLSLSK